MKIKFQANTITNAYLKCKGTPSIPFQIAGTMNKKSKTTIAGKIYFTKKILGAVW